MVRGWSTSNGLSGEHKEAGLVEPQGRVGEEGTSLPAPIRGELQRKHSQVLLRGAEAQQKGGR